MSIQISDTFQFKKFVIAQNHDVFRVNSEAILLASWIRPIHTGKILEIGSGTGIISIALAYRFGDQNQISCIDIDSKAFDLTQYNICLNECNSIEAFNLSLQEFSGKSRDNYDFIVSNPPFFDGRYKSSKARNARAKYTDSLSFDSLLTLSRNLLADQGTIYLVLPNQAVDEIKEICDKLDLHLVSICYVAPKIGKKTNRILLEISKYSVGSIRETALSILDENGDYTDEYKIMTEEFYTIF